MNIGIVSTRLAGNDGVSLETAKLAAVLASHGHTLAYLAGELEPGLPGHQVPALHFTDPVARDLGARAFQTKPDPTILSDIAARAETLREPIEAFLDAFAVDYVIVQNAFAIPMQLPLAKALADVMRRRGLRGLAHNHDFYWERGRFSRNQVGDFLDTYFPPAWPELQQATINSLAQAELRERRGLISTLIPNVFDFANPPPVADSFARSFRETIGLSAGDWLILQPTRVVPRKGIELAIEAVARLDDPRAKLVLTHQAGDEGFEYFNQLLSMAQELGVDLRYVAGQVDDKRGVAPDGTPIYALWDTYAVADFVMYPSLVEGFGNALLETVYFGLPALVNRYEVYVADIAPKGFRFVEIDGAVTDRAVAGVAAYLADERLVRSATAHNYEIAREHYSFETLDAILTGLGL